MSNIACYLQATTKRLDYLEATIHSINKLSDKFQEKFVSIHGEGITLGIVNLLETTNWKVDLFTGDRISAFKRSINSISADYIFYIEDDIELLDFPDEMYDESKDTRHPWMRRYAWECDPLISAPWSPGRPLTSVSEVDLLALSF